MAFHELCTNAIKYGALSLPEGQVVVSWSTDGDTLAITWQETGGPPVTPPTRKGFGRVVAEQVLATTLNATISTDFAPKGLICSLCFPASEFNRPIH